MRLVAALLVPFLLLGCDPAPKGPNPPVTPEPLPVSKRREKPWHDFAARLQKVFEDGVEVSKNGHPGGGPAVLYASPWAAEALRKLGTGRDAGASSFRSGSLIVLQHPDGTVYVMRKRPLGHFPETNDWYFALVREERVILESGTAKGDQVQEACADCHSTLAKSSDWVAPPRPR